MNRNIRTKNFDIQNRETEVENLLLWESHCHVQYEMISVLEGDIDIMLEGRHCRLTSGQSVIISPLCYHTITANKKGQYRRITVLFDLPAIPPVLQKKFCERLCDNYAFFSVSIDELEKACRAEDPLFYEPLIESLMVRILYACAETGQGRTTDEIDEILQKIIYYIDEHLCEKIRLCDIARYAARSESSLCHMFREKMKISVKQYILQKKLSYAAKQIQDGMPPTLAANLVGYENYSNFYRMYRKVFGAAPTGKRR